MTLLSRTDQNKKIQENALNCVGRYRFKWLTPYMEEVQGIIYDKDTGFRERLLTFRATDSSATRTVVQPEHRAELMPLMYRILVGKMLERKVKGKGMRNPKLRRRAILRFVTAGSQAEVESFLSHLFSPFDAVMACDDMPDKSVVVPLRRQVGFMNIVQDLLSALGSKFDFLLPQVINILMRLVEMTDHYLSDRAQIGPAYIGVLKNIRLLGKYARTCMREACYACHVKYTFGCGTLLLESVCSLPSCSACVRPYLTSSFGVRAALFAAVVTFCRHKASCGHLH